MPRKTHKSRIIPHNKTKKIESIKRDKTCYTDNEMGEICSTGQYSTYQGNFYKNTKNLEKFDLIKKKFQKDPKYKGYKTQSERYTRFLKDNFRAGELPKAVHQVKNDYYGYVNEEWFKENLRTTKYANGTDISNVTDNASWNNLSTGAWANYDNNVANDAIYGKLYNWYAVSDVRGLCPTGWHVADDLDWTSLTALYGTDAAAGNELKSTTSWTTTNSNSNTSGFGAAPGGGRGGGLFGDITNKGFWWTSTLFDSSNSYARRLEYNLDTVARYYESNKSGFSVRCVKN